MPLFMKTTPDILCNELFGEAATPYAAPFGSRYIAKRVDVTVLAQDDKVTAIDAELFGYEYVITNSSKYIENKDQVKLAD